MPETDRKYTHDFFNGAYIFGKPCSFYNRKTDIFFAGNVFSESFFRKTMTNPE